MQIPEGERAAAKARFMRLGRLLTVAGLCLSAATTGRAQPGAGSAIAAGDDLEIYVMTMGPGDQVWSRFGHNAIGIRDRTAGTDIVYNWGTFDFQQSNFLLRFIQGRMLYWVADGDARLTEAAYDQDNRAVQVQELALTAEQRVAVRDYIAWNMREENRFYRYDYFLDNCSTRVRDVLDRALGGALRRQFEASPSGMSFRDEARRLMEPDPWIYTGIDAGLGSPSDREMSRWDAMFIPMRLRDLLREVQVPGSGGQLLPLVTSERTVVATTRRPDAPVPLNHLLRYLLIGAAFALVVVVSASRGAGGLRLARVIGIAWCVFAGILGLLLLGLWTATDHVWAYANTNLLFFHPLWFAVIPLVRRAGRPVAGAGKAVIVACGILAMVGLVVGLAGVPQKSGQMAALAIPLAAATAWLVISRPSVATRATA